jgi:cytoskeletal protein CcmA (bactofilin family)
MFDLNKKDSARPGGEASPGQAQGSPSSGGSSSYSTATRAAGGSAAVIGRSIQIVGDLRGDEDLRIEGDIEGNIHLPNHSLTIGSEGRINADAYAKSVIVDGEINGDIYGSECVTIRAKARVRGNILASRVSLEEGARFKGSIDMDPQSVKGALEKVQGLVSSGQPQRDSAIRPNGSGGGQGAAIVEPSASKTTPASKSAKVESTL